MSDNTLILNDKGIKQLLKAFKGNQPMARIGVLGDKAARAKDVKGKGINNAMVLAFAEYGTTKSPIRSVLRVPLSQFLMTYLERSGAFDDATLKAVIASGSLIPWLKKVGITAEVVVQDAFNTGGFGAWPPSDMTNKKNHQTLVETQQLRNSITSDAK